MVALPNPMSHFAQARLKLGLRLPKSAIKKGQDLPQLVFKQTGHLEEL